MERDVIEINEDLCTGCGNCVPNCHQGALQVVDGKVRLLSDLFCEGLGACVGHCPTGAMKVTRREAEPYDEVQVMEKMLKGGPAVVRAHMQHLSDHRQDALLARAREILVARGIADPLAAGETARPGMDIRMASRPGTGTEESANQGGGGCPGSRARMLRTGPALAGQDMGGSSSAPGSAPLAGELRQWPVQFHLLNPQAPFFAGAHVLLAADCTAFAAGNFHRDYLKGKILAIACPKLDEGQESYVDKIAALADHSGIETLTVLIMEVPCCSGLARLAKAGLERARRKVPMKLIVLDLEGNQKSSEWV